MSLKALFNKYRSSNRLSTKALAQRPTEEGIALCVCVLPGIGTNSFSFENSNNTLQRLRTFSIISNNLSLEYNLTSKSIWSFLLLAVCIFFPTSPSLLVRKFSTAVCTSSSSFFILNFPSSCKSKISIKLVLISRSSSSEIIPIS